MGFLILIFISSNVVAKRDVSMPQCINIHLEKEMNMSSMDAKSCIKTSKIHIYNKTMEIDSFLQKSSPSDGNSMMSNLSCVIDSNTTAPSSDTCICKSLVTIPLSADDKCQDYCTIIRVYVHAATMCICDACNENHMMVYRYFVKSPAITEGSNTTFKVLGGLFGGLLVGLVIGTGLAVWLFKRNTSRDPSSGPEPEVKYMSKENKEPVDYHSYVGGAGQSVDNHIDDRECPDYDNVLYG